jgi:uncharacterized GH25 family protein
MLRKPSISVLLGLCMCGFALPSQKGASTATALNAGECIVVVQVTDSHQRPITGAHVSLTGTSTSPSPSKFRLDENTDQKGRVRFAGLPRGHLQLSAEANGRRTKQMLDTTEVCTSSLGVVIPD